ncbi:MAG: hypothetical protein DRR06_16510 [Gammaproteobacteria bacterium]|nr:MAG: hypothetical protein DRR06_16510 [Gammaproteobacteria bacterium]
MTVIEYVRQRFSPEAQNSTITREIVAGATTFFTIAYIFIINPSLLGSTGLDQQTVLTATILISALATIGMGLLANVPLILAPGMEMNSYFVFILVGYRNIDPQSALGIVFWCGVLFIIANITNLRTKLIQEFPTVLKSSFSIAMGAFLVVVGLKIGGVLIYNEHLICSGIGVLEGPAFWIFVLSVSAVYLFDGVLKIRGGILLSVIITFIVSHLAGWLDVSNSPSPSGSIVSSIKFMPKLNVLSNGSAISALLTLFVIDFFGSIAKVVSMTKGTKLEITDGDTRALKRALYVDGIATTGGALMGTSNVTIYVESHVGIRQGARTGLSSVVCGILMLAVLPFSKWLSLIPVNVAAGVLVYIGFLIINSTKTPLMTAGVQEKISMFLMAAMVVGTLSLDKAILIGLISSVIQSVRNKNPISPVLLISTIVLAGAVWTSWV